MIVNKYNNGGGSSTYSESAGTANFAELSNSTKLLEGGEGLPQDANAGDVVAVAPALALLSTRGTKGLRSAASTALGVYQYEGQQVDTYSGLVITIDWNTISTEAAGTDDYLTIYNSDFGIDFNGEGIFDGTNTMTYEEAMEEYEHFKSIFTDPNVMDVWLKVDSNYAYVVISDPDAKYTIEVAGKSGALDPDYTKYASESVGSIEDYGPKEYGRFVKEAEMDAAIQEAMSGVGAYKIELSNSIPDDFTETDIANLNAFFAAVEEDPSIAEGAYVIADSTDIYRCSYLEYDGENHNATIMFDLNMASDTRQIELGFENGEYDNGSFISWTNNTLIPTYDLPADPMEGQIANYDDGNGNIGLYRYDGSDWQPYGGGPQGPQGPAGQNGANGSQGPQGPQGPAGSGGGGDNTSLMPIQELPVSGETGEVVALAYDVERPTAPNSGSVYGGSIAAFIDAIEASPNGRVVIQNGDSNDWTDWGYFEKQNDVYGFYDYQAEVWHPFDSMTEGWNDEIYWYPMQRIGDNVFFYDRRNDGSTFFTPSINMMFNVVGQVADGVYQYDGEEWVKIGENETYQVNLSTSTPDYFTQDDIDNLNAFFTKCAEDHSLPVRTFINAAGNIYHNSYVGFTDNENAEMFFTIAFQDYLEQMNLYFADGEYSNGSLTGNSIGSPYNEYGNLLGVGMHDTEADKVIKFDIDNDPDDYTIGSYQAIGEGDSNVYVKEKSIVTSTNIKRMVKITESDYDTLVNNQEVDESTFYIVVADPQNGE